MVDATKFFGGEYLKAADISGPTKLTIREANETTLPDGKTKIVVEFDEIEKGLVLNKINTTRIAKWTGSIMTEDWPGKTITLVKDTVEYDGEDVPCIRVLKKEEVA